MVPCVTRSCSVCSHACLREGNGTSVPKEMEIKQFRGSGWCKERLWCALCLGIGLGFLVLHLAVIPGSSVPPFWGDTNCLLAELSPVPAALALTG